MIRLTFAGALGSLCERWRRWRRNAAKDPCIGDTWISVRHRTVWRVVAVVGREVDLEALETEPSSAPPARRRVFLEVLVNRGMIRLHSKRQG